MSSVITITGQTATAGSAQTIDISGQSLPPIKSLLKAELIRGAHQHDVTTVAAAGGGSAMTEPLVAGPLETAGAGQVNAGAVDSGTTLRAELTIVTATPTGVEEIQVLTVDSLSVWLTDALTVNDQIVLTVEDVGSLVRPT